MNSSEATYPVCLFTGKRIYPTSKAAAEGLHLCKRIARLKKVSIPIRFYFCKSCKGYHLTSRTSAEQTKKKYFKRMRQKQNEEIL